MQSTHIFLALTLTCAVTTYGLGPFRGTCKKVAVFKKGEKDRALRDHVISSHKVASRLDCADQCLQTSGCKSYNYQETGSPPHTCELSTRTKTSKPSDYVIKSGFTYYDAQQFVLDVCASAPCQNGGTCGIDECTDSYECVCKPGYIGENCETWLGLNGSSSSHPSHSCLNLKLSGQDTGDGRYWINPKNTGSPFVVYCDMKTDGGGWTLIKDLTLINSSPSGSFNDLADYRGISNPNRYEFATQPVLMQLKQDMGFTQIRYFCRKASVGRVFHIMTATNALGLDAVRYFIVNNSPFATACNSFVRLPDDRSVAATNCAKWGHKYGVSMTNTWGHSSTVGQYRPYNRVVAWPSTHVVSFIGGDYRCDDNDKGGQAGDTWKMFVR